MATAIARQRGRGKEPEGHRTRARFPPLRLSSASRRLSSRAAPEAGDPDPISIFRSPMRAAYHAPTVSLLPQYTCFERHVRDRHRLGEGKDVLNGIVGISGGRTHHVGDRVARAQVSERSLSRSRPWSSVPPHAPTKKPSPLDHSRRGRLQIVLLIRLHPALIGLGEPRPGDDPLGWTFRRGRKPATQALAVTQSATTTVVRSSTRFMHSLRAQFGSGSEWCCPNGRLREREFWPIVGPVDVCLTGCYSASGSSSGSSSSETEFMQ